MLGPASGRARVDLSHILLLGFAWQKKFPDRQAHFKARHGEAESYDLRCEVRSWIESEPALADARSHERPPAADEGAEPLMAP